MILSYIFISIQVSKTIMPWKKISIKYYNIKNLYTTQLQRVSDVLSDCPAVFLNLI